MKVNSTNFLIGVFLILLGGFFLLGTLTDLRIREEIVLASIIFVTGVVMLLSHIFFDRKLWTLIMGCSGIFIGSAITIEEWRLLPSESISMILFILVGLVFLSGLRKGKKNWWALIPGGFSIVIAGSIFLDMQRFISDAYIGVLLFAGMGIIFGILFLMRDEEYNLDWAKYPSLVGFILSAIIVLTIDFRDMFSRYLFPILLIAIGIFILVRSLARSRERIEPSESTDVEPQPAAKSASGEATKSDSRKRAPKAGAALKSTTKKRTTTKTPAKQSTKKTTPGENDRTQIDK